MSRSSSLARSVLRPPHSPPTTRLGPAVLGKELRRSVEIELDAKRPLDSCGNRPAILVATIASDPLSHRFGLSAGQSGLASRALQRTLQAAGGASMEPAIDAVRGNADECRYSLDRSAVLQLGKSSEPLAPMLVALAHGTLAQVSSALRQVAQPWLPRPAALRSLGGCRSEDGPQPFRCSVVKVCERSEQTLKAWRAESGDGSRQAHLKIAQQPGQQQQSTVRACDEIIESIASQQRY